MKLVNTQVTGATQWSGKTTSMIAYDIMPSIEAEDSAVVFADPHSTGGMIVAGHVLEAGMDDRLILIDPTRDYYGGWGFFQRSRHPNRHRRKKENRMFCRMAAEVLSVGRVGSIDETRVIKEWVMAAIGAWQEHDEDLSPQEIPNFLRPWTTNYDFFVTGIKDDPIRDKISQVKTIAKDPRTFNTLIGPALRLLEELFSEPVFNEMLVETFNLEEAVLNKAVIILLGAEEEYLSKILIKSLLLRLVQITMARWARSREPTLMRIGLDEASRIAGENEANAAGKTLKMGQSWLFISQTADYNDPFINLRMEQNTTEKIMMHSASPEVTRHDADHLKLNLDAFRIHHTTRRKVHTGYETHATVSEGETEDGQGKKRKTKNRGTTMVSTYQDVEDAHYWNLGDQMTLNEKSLMELNTGECYVRRGNKLVGPIYIPKLPTPFLYDGAAEQYIELHMQRQLDQGLLRYPVERICNPATNGTARRNGHARANANGNSPRGKGKGERKKSGSSRASTS